MLAGESKKSSDRGPRKFGLLEAANNKIGSAVDQLLLYCYHYDPVTGKYGMVIMTVIRISGTATVLVLAVYGGNVSS